MREAVIRRLPLEFHVIGSTDRDAAFARSENVHVSGRYREHEVYARLAAERCHLAFLPSECPESFSYTLSIAMAARMFVVCFDLAAQAERVRAWGWGRPLAIDLEPGAINDELLAAARSLSARPVPPRAPAPAQYPDVLMSYYEFTPGERNRLTGRVSRAVHVAGSSPHVVPGGTMHVFTSITANYLPKAAGWPTRSSGCIPKRSFTSSCAMKCRSARHPPPTPSTASSTSSNCRSRIYLPGSSSTDWSSCALP